MHLRLSNNFIKRCITASVLGAFFWTVGFYAHPLVFSLTLLLILTIIIVYEWRRLFSVHNPAFWLLMPLYPILPFFLLINLNHDMPHRHLLLVLFILVFSFDSGAYIAGSLWGKHPLCSPISPNKTWEGVAGGLVCAILGLRFLLYELEMPVNWCTIVWVSCIVSILSLMGDLFESYLKRSARVKDSGTTLPGHGGFLDRFDGILFTVFFFFYFRDYLLLIFPLSIASP